MRASEYNGLSIYSEKGYHVGEVQEIVLNSEEAEIFGLGIRRNGGKVTTIPYENVIAVGDIVLVRSG